MSKRPLSRYAWGELFEPSEPPSKRARFDDETEEPTTVMIDEPRMTPQEHGMAILNSMPVDKRSTIPDTGGSRNTIAEEVPTVSLDQHYNSLYNRMMSTRFPKQPRHDDSDSSESEESLPYDTNRREECFLCSYKKKYQVGLKDKHIKRLFDIESKYSQCNNVDLALMLELYYKQKVYKPNQNMPMLTKEIALEHIEGLHSLSPKIFLGETMRATMKIMFGFQNAIFKANGKHDKDTFILFEKTVKLICLLYKMDPSLMLFNAEGVTREDTALIGRTLTLLPQVKTQKDKNKRTKRTERLNMADESFERGFDI